MEEVNGFASKFFTSQYLISFLGADDIIFIDGTLVPVRPPIGTNLIMEGEGCDKDHSLKATSPSLESNKPIILKLGALNTPTTVEPSDTASYGLCTHPKYIIHLKVFFYFA